MFAAEKSARAIEERGRLRPPMVRSIYLLRVMKTHQLSLRSVFRRLAFLALVVGMSLMMPPAIALAQAADDTPDAVAIFNQAQDLHEKGDLAGAITLYEKALKSLAEFPEAEYQRGSAYLILGNTAEAEKAFRRAVELRADWTLALAALGSLLVHKDELTEAEKALKKVVEIEPNNPLALAGLADLRIRTNAAPDVLQGLLVKLVVLTAKANPPATLWTARAALENALGKRGPAKQSLESALAIDPKNRTALLLLADLALADGDIVRANQIAARLAGDVSSDPSKLLRASILAQEGKYEDALKQLDALERPRAPAHDLRKRINASRAANPADLEKQLETDVRNPLILGRLCSMYRRDDPARALSYCRRASEAEPNNVNHAVGFGAALVQAKQFDAAVGLFTKLLALVPDNSTARANLATALFQMKRYEEAKAEFRWLTNAQPKAAGAYYFLAIVHDQLTEYMDASANYQQYLRLADPVENKLEIEKVNLRLPILQKLIKDGKGKRDE